MVPQSYRVRNPEELVISARFENWITSFSFTRLRNQSGPQSSQQRRLTQGVLGGRMPPISESSQIARLGASQRPWQPGDASWPPGDI